MQITTGPTLLSVPLLRCVMSRKKIRQNKVKQKYVESDLTKKKKTKANGTIQCQKISDTHKLKPKQMKKEKKKKQQNMQMHYFQVYNNGQSEFVRFVDISDK